MDLHHGPPSWHAIRIDACIEAAYYATNNGFARPFSKDGWADKCPVILGEASPVVLIDR